MGKAQEIGANVVVESVSTTKRSYRHLLYAVISIACPFLALGITSIYQDYAYAWFWEPKSSPIDDADINAGAMMGIVIVVQLILALGVGSVVGLRFAGLSLRRRPRIFSFGTAALILNLVPAIGVIAFYLKGLMWGF